MSKDPRHNHPTLTWDRMSAWQRKQYGVKPPAPSKVACPKCHKHFTPIGGQPFCNGCGPLDASGLVVPVGAQVRIARWRLATPGDGADTRIGTVYKVEQQADKRWVLYMTFPPAPNRRGSWCSFSYDMVRVLPGTQFSLF